MYWTSGELPRDDHARHQHKSRRGIAALIGIVALIAAMAVSFRYVGHDQAAGDGTQAAGNVQPTGDVLLESVNFAGVSPFSAPVGVDLAGVAPPPTLSGTQPGSRPGLFGGTEKQASCDPLAMIRFLQANPDKAAAWAGVLGITQAEIPGFIASLTPAILRADVSVTNHGFLNGRATNIPAVLQAGTAVLLDKFGFPVTKCFCGNPLTRPAAFQKVTFVGTPWPTFSVTQITIVQAAPTIINQFVFVQPVTGTAFVRPAGTDGRHDQPAAPGLIPPPDSGPPPAPAQPSATVAPTTAAPPSRAAPPGRAAPPVTAAPTTTTPGAGPATGGAPAGASWVVGTCFAESVGGSIILNGPFLVRNNDTASTHSYQVTVSFGEFGDVAVAVNGVQPGQAAQGKATKQATGAVTPGTVDCDITTVTDENGQQLTNGPALSPPPDLRTPATPAAPSAPSPAPSPATAPTTSPATGPTTEPPLTSTPPAPTTTEPLTPSPTASPTASPTG